MLNIVDMLDLTEWNRSSSSRRQTRPGLRYDTARPEILCAFHDYAHALHNAFAVDNRNALLDQEHIDWKRMHLTIVADHVKKFPFRAILHRLHRNAERVLNGSGHERHSDEHAWPKMAIRIRKLCLEKNGAACRINDIIDKYQLPLPRLFLPGVQCHLNGDVAASPVPVAGVRIPVPVR